MSSNPDAPRILVVDDEPQLRRLLRTTLGAHGYQVLQAENGADGLRITATELPDLVILDLGLPDFDGQEVITRIREWSEVPIIVLSVREGESEKVGALDAGADDYVTKPFGAGELLARIRATLRNRRGGRSEQSQLQIGDLHLDVARHTLTVDGREVRATPKEFALLRLLMQHAGRVLTHRYILRELWGPAAVDEHHYLRVHVANLRQKIEPDPARPRYILTEPGVGYRMEDSER